MAASGETCSGIAYHRLKSGFIYSTFLLIIFMRFHMLHIFRSSLFFRSSAKDIPPKIVLPAQVVLLGGRSGATRDVELDRTWSSALEATAKKINIATSSSRV